MIEIKEGDFVMGSTSEGIIHGVVEHIMDDGGTLGTPGSEYALESMPPENPAMSVRVYKENSGKWEPTAYSIGMMYKDAEKDNIKDGSEEMYSEMGKSYYSENEDEDKWDNITKACWVGYTQRGMKDKDGRMVPNCVPVNKLKDSENEMAKAKPNYEDMITPRKGGSTPSNPQLYARVVQAAKDKFDVYPSAVANSWVVQEYKRRGGTYKIDQESTTKNIWDGSFDPRNF